MAQRRMIECKHKGCISLTRSECGYCDEHLEEYQENEKQRKKQTNRFYNKNRDKVLYKFYQSNQWKSVRLAALIRDNYLCQDCIKEKKITEAQHVHHIEEVKDNWDRRYDIENVVSLCPPCHNRRHGGGK